ncbi:probable non-heme bromoperoxidase BpoC at C-terminar half [Coccomyxa sp. Obi]|nr:probable non-heme bromoperoxidase BpoC at C-terminar half [Coccomyxa sp. Obi]
MPIAKLVSADGPVNIYYELQGRVSTNRDDFSYSKAAQNVKEYEKEPSSLNSTAETDPELGRVKGAIDSAIAADRRADTGKRMLASQGSRASQMNGKSLQESSIELTDMSEKARPAVQRTSSGTSADPKGDSQSPTGGPESVVSQQNRVREGEHVIEMPHEDTTEASSRQGSCKVVLYCAALHAHKHSHLGICLLPFCRGLEATDASVCANVLFICGMSARGRTEFFHPIVRHLASLTADPSQPGPPLLTCCTFDNRGIGNSSIPQSYAAYRTHFMAADALALMDHLDWRRAHVMGMSLGGMIGCKMMARAPTRIASLTMLSTTATGLQMAGNMMTHPWITLRAGAGPLDSRIPANLRANFSRAYLSQKVDGGRTRKQVLTDSTWEAIRLGLTEKFLAEGQPEIGRNGHVLSVLTHRLSRAEIRAMRGAGVPMQLINGRADVVAGLCWVKKLARHLRCPLILTDGAHAGICLETPQPIIAAMERIMNVPKLRMVAAKAAAV